MSTETGINFIDEICANNIIKMDIMSQYLHHQNLIIPQQGDYNFGVETGHNSIRNNIEIRYGKEAIKFIDEIFGFLSGQKLSFDDASRLLKYISENYSQLFIDFIQGRYDELSDESKGYVKYLVKYCGDLFKHGGFEEDGLFRKFSSAYQIDAEEIYRMFIKIGIANQRHWISRGVHGKEYRYNRGYVPESAWEFMGSITHEIIQMKPEGAFVSHAGKTPLDLFGFEKILQLETKEEMIERVLKLEPSGFEKFMGFIFNRLGFKVEVTKSVGDRGVDIILSFKDKLEFQYKILVECKRYSLENKVGIEPIIKLKGAMGSQQVKQGLLVTTGNFSSGVREEAEKDYGIKTWNREDLLKVLTEIIS